MNAIPKSLSKCAVAIILIGATAFTFADTLGNVKIRGKLIAGVNASYPPYGFLNSEGKLAGVEVDLARFIGSQILGSAEKVELVPVNASNRIEFLQAGRIDLILNLGITSERGKVVDFTEPYIGAPGAAVLAEAGAKFTKWEQLKGQTVCGVQGAFYNTNISATYGIEFANFAALPEAYRALRDNRCVGLVYDYSVLGGKLSDPEWGGYRIAVQPYEQVMAAGGVRKGDKAFLDAVNAAIIKAEADDKVMDWQKSYKVTPNEYTMERAKKAKAARK
jgi:polar amino acid transport system substrate-binding protein